MQQWLQKIREQTEQLLASQLEPDVQTDVQEILLSTAKLQDVLSLLDNAPSVPPDTVHRLRTSLNVVIGFTEILIDSNQLREAQLQHLKKIYESAEHLLQDVDHQFG